MLMKIRMPELLQAERLTSEWSGYTAEDDLFKLQDTFSYSS
jgi:hypothetical protein